MKKLTLLFSTSLFLTFSHVLCCFLPYMALLPGVMSLPLYLGFLEDFQWYIFVIQLIVITYNFYYLYWRRRGGLVRAKVIFWITLIISVFALVFPQYQHAKAQKANIFGKRIIHNIK